MAPLQLSSIEQTPRTVPAWDLILEDLGNPPAHRIARVLGVGRSTVYRWHQDGTGPRIACLALYWLTRWGRSAVHTQATNDAVMAVQLARSLGEERDALAARLVQIETERHGLAYALAAERVAQLAPAAGSPGAMPWPELYPLQPWPSLACDPQQEVRNAGG